MTFCCEVELGGVRYQCEYSLWRHDFTFRPEPPTPDVRQTLEALVNRAKYEYLKDK